MPFPHSHPQMCNWQGLPSTRVVMIRACSLQPGRLVLAISNNSEKQRKGIYPLWPIEKMNRKKVSVTPSLSCRSWVWDLDLNRRLEPCVAKQCWSTEVLPITDPLLSQLLSLLQSGLTSSQNCVVSLPGRQALNVANTSLQHFPLPGI